MTDQRTTPGYRAVGALANTPRAEWVDRCLSDNDAAAYLDGSISSDERERTRDHLDHCEPCRQLVLHAIRALAPSGPTSSGAPPLDGPSVERDRLDGRLLIGRFALLEVLGSGGMGIVYAAYDSELDRKVALKLVRTDIRDHRPEAARQSMIREAKAMARVEHPNVITVYEAGTHDDHVYVAMELVAGGDLRRWLAHDPLDWQSRLAVCCQAGAGLAAAHRAGLIHRDFKPDNVLVGSDRRVRVTDFGLARAASASERVADSSLPSASSLDARLTRTGAIVGTPAYMAPEQHRGEPADARADQFAFCVTVWEALYGERPFAGASYPELAANVLDGALREPPRSAVPARVRSALTRGLSIDPAARFGSMDELLAELAIAPRRRWPWIAAVIAPLAIGGTWLIARGDDSQREATCPTADSKLASVWDAGRREATRGALTRAAPFGATIATRTLHDLDEYAARWSAAWAATCRASESGEQSPTMFDLRVACLTKRLRGVDTVVAALNSAQPAVAARALELVDRLSPIEPCNDPATLTQQAPEPATLPAVAALDDRLEASYAMRLGGQISEARKVTEQLLGDAERLGHRPSIANALLALARIDQDVGDFAAAEQRLQRASTVALASNHDEITAEVLTALADIVGYELARPAEANRLVEIARGAIERIGNPPRHRLALLATEGRIAQAAGKLDRAELVANQGIELAKQIGEEYQVIPLLSLKELVLTDTGRFDEAFALNARELDIRSRLEGESHPLYASALVARATLHLARNQFTAGRADLERARTIITAALGPDSPELLTVESNAGVVAGLLGDWEGALRAARKSRTVAEKQNGLKHPATALAICNVGSALRELGRPSEAEPHLLEALKLRRELFGDQHADVSTSLQELAELRLVQGRPREAAQLFRESIATLHAAVGDSSPLLPYAQAGLGRSELALGSLPAARKSLTSAVARLAELDLDPVLTARTQLALADVEWRSGARTAARQRAVAAGDALAKLPADSNQRLRGELARWRAAH